MNRKSKESQVDLHPPLKPIHTWQEFLIHLLTITIGLFIALTLEATIESIHHWNLVRGAHVNLQREIAANHALYADNARNIRENRNQLARDIDQLRQLRDGKKPDPANLSWSWDWKSYDDSAWSTARASGAVSYMDPSQISAYSKVYTQQQYINETVLAILNDETKAGAALQVAMDPAKLTPSEIEALLLKTAELDQSFGMLETTTMNKMDVMYEELLQQH
jgi:hypothetical protein